MMRAGGLALVPLASSGAVLFGIDFDKLPPGPAYALIFALVAIEYLGIPAPGETSLILGALLAAATHHLAIQWVILVAAVAAFIGSNIGFAIGYFGGSRVLLRLTRWLHIKDERLKVARYLFNHYGVWVILLGRFVTILRAYISLLAGVTRMPYLRFEIASVVGALLWAGLWGIVYYEAGAVVLRYGGATRIVLAVIAVALVVVGIVVVRMNEGRLTALAEREMPGPLDFGGLRRAEEPGARTEE
jgi:membrane protein DedA with SNARE-associated domain